MTTSVRTDIEMEEYKPTYLPKGDPYDSVAESIYRAYDTQIEIETPSFKNGDRWKLTPQGWVGYIPVSDEVGLRIKPKVPLHNIVRMLEYAYGLKGLKFFDELASSDSLQEFFSELANILARRVLERGRRGFYKAYVDQTETLSYVRGRLLVHPLVRRPWDPRIQCEFDDHVADVRDNQLLTWTLATILRSGFLRVEVLPVVRRAYLLVQSFTSVVPFSAKSSRTWLYNRLNDDYEPMHAICRFFLDHASPSHLAGAESTLPFLIDMAKLFESFVAEWLRTHLPNHLALRAQEQVRTGLNGEIDFVIDLVVYETNTLTAKWVLDTKYKPSARPSPDDVAQVVAYAKLKGCDHAALVYPVGGTDPYLGHFGDVSVRSMTFSLAGDLDVAGQQFLAKLAQG